MVVRKLRSGRYQVDWLEESGKRSRKNFKTKALAERFKAQRTLFENADEKGRLAQNMRDMTVRELAERFVEDHLNHTASKSNASYLTKHVIGGWGDVRLSRLQYPEVKSWFMAILNEPDEEKRLSVSTVKKILVYFKWIFSWGIEMRIIAVSPLQGLMFKNEFKKVTKRNVKLDPEEFWALYDQLPTEPEYLKQMTLAAWCSGMRFGEIRGLKWSHINFREGLIRLGANDTKEGCMKTVGIEPEFLEQLKAIQDTRPTAEQDDFVYLTPKGKPITAAVFCRRFKKSVLEAGYDDLHLHDLRHSYCGRKRREGFDRSVIMAQMGHRTETMFHLYDNVEEDELRAMAGGEGIGDSEMSGAITELVAELKRKGIPLGAAQSLIAQQFKAKAA